MPPLHVTQPWHGISLSRSVALYESSRYRVLLNEVPLVEKLLRAMVAKEESEHGEQSTEYATAANNLAELLRHEGKYDAAEGLYRQAVDIWMRVHEGEEHPLVATGMRNLARVLFQQKPVRKPLSPNAPEHG